MNPKFFKVMALIVILSINFQNNVFGKDSKNIEDFSRKLQELRDLSMNLSTQISLLTMGVNIDSQFDRNLRFESPFLLRDISRISSLSHVYILQLNEFDPSLEIRKITGKKALEIPEKSPNYCCWKSVSIVYMQISYEIQEILKNEIIKNINYQSPQVLHSIRNILEKLQSCLKYFGDYFAEHG